MMTPGRESTPPPHFSSVFSKPRSVLGISSCILHLCTHTKNTKNNSAVTEWHGCGENKDRKLGTWAVGEATHNPSFNARWSDDVIEWLLK